MKNCLIFFVNGDELIILNCFCEIMLLKYLRGFVFFFGVFIKMNGGEVDSVIWYLKLIMEFLYVV